MPMPKGKRFGVVCYWPYYNDYGTLKNFPNFKSAWANVVQGIDWGYGVSYGDYDHRSSEIVLQRLKPEPCEIETRPLIKDKEGSLPSFRLACSECSKPMQSASDFIRPTLDGNVVCKSCEKQNAVDLLSSGMGMK